MRIRDQRAYYQAYYGLGRLRENPVILRAAAAYLEAF